MKIWIFITALLLIGNILIFLNREHFEYYKQLSYNDLYARESRSKINAFEQDGKGNLRIITDSAPVNFQLQSGVHQYRVFLSPDTVELTAEYNPATKEKPAFTAVYAVGHELENQFVVCRRMFTADTSLFPAAQKILRDSVFTGNERTTSEKAKAISIFLHKKIFASRGEPSSSTLKLNALDAYYAACRGEKIWCGIYTQIYDLFLQAAGIFSKTVEIRQNMPGISGSVHEFNHYYDPEAKTFIFSDLMFNVICARSGSGKTLNPVDFKNADWSDSSIRMLRATGDSVTEESLSNADAFMKSLYGKDKDLVFYGYSAEGYHGSLWKKIKNYSTARPWYGIYSDMRVYSNRGFYFKQGMLILLGLSLLITAAVLIFRKKRKTNDRV